MTTRTEETASRPGAAGAWLRCFHRAPQAPLRLVCFPHAGGSASFYFALSADLAPDVEVLAVQYPGRQDRRLEPAVTDVAELARHVADALVEAADGRPYALFGHSMGATLAFETALLFESGLVPEPPRVTELFVSARRAPRMVRDERTHALPEADFLREIQSLDGSDAALFADEEMLRMVLPALRADYRAIESHRADPNARVACPITALVGDADPKATIAEATAWSAHTTGRFDLRIYPGGHFYLVTHRDAVARHLRGTRPES